MKKLLGLLLNCFALCLCSAIGIGAGMYWIQTTEKNASTILATHQTQGTDIQPVSQRPDLMPTPESAKRLKVNHIPDQVAPFQEPLTQTGYEAGTKINNEEKTLVSLSANNKEIGSLNPDSDHQKGTTDPADRIFYLSREELKSLQFKVKLQSGTANETIKDVSGVAGITLIEVDAGKRNATYSIPPQEFNDNELTIKLSLTLTEAEAPSVTQNFTFKIKNVLYFDSVKLPASSLGPPASLENDGVRQLAGPTENLIVTVGGYPSADYKLNLVHENKILETNTREATHTFELKQTGNYQLKLYETGVTEPNQEFRFKVLNVTVNQPKYPEIVSVIDVINPSQSSENILYTAPNSVVKGIPCYLLRKSNVTLNVSKAEDRTAVLEYQKIDSISSQEEFKASSSKSDNSASANISFSFENLAPGIYRFRVRDYWISDPKPDETNIFTILIPNPDVINPLKPSIVSFKNQKYSEPTSAIPDTIEVFGGYLELDGKNANPEHPLEFVLYHKKEDHSELLTSDSLSLTYRPTEKGTWHAEFNIQEDLDGAVTLYVLRQDNEQHAFSSPLNLNLNAVNLPDTAAELAEFTITHHKGNKKLDEESSVFYINTHSPVIQTTKANLDNIQYVLYTQQSNSPIGFGDFNNNKTAKLLTPLTDGQHKIYIKLTQGKQVSNLKSNPFTLNIQVNGLEVIDIQPPNFGTAAGVEKLKIKFSDKNLISKTDFPLNEMSDIKLSSFQLIPGKGTGNFLFGTAIPPASGEYQSYDNAIVLTFPKIPADIYQLVITGDQVVDLFGNRLEGSKGEPGTNYIRVLNKPDTEAKTSGETEMSTSEFVPYHEYEKRDPPAPGFNPSDKVVTRVARLYYYRDAHRVAQILNSEVKSLNQKGYHDAQVLADKARVEYESTVKKRRLQEEKAIQAAETLRQKENDYRMQQQILSRLIRERANLEKLDTDDQNVNKDQLEKRRNSLETDISKAQTQLTELRSDISTLSTKMKEEDYKLKELNLDEENLSADLFQKEVRAEKTDLYTIANGKPESYDAVQQVTIKVIGEGLIHLRGPIKGVNIIRTMINQIDSPVGQVRIAMHTIQINGEDGKRMEIVADRIQKSIDQSRFLTVQSSQMLRKAIVAVASEVAISSCQDGVGYTQQQRDEKYLYAFFGQDFIEALREMDSEFLQSGNKLLSIHSMDTTSLASALFVLALAKNEIRQQILARFYASLETELPEDELQFLYQGGPTKANKHKHVHLLAPYAHFQSFKGFFDHEVIGTDTMTPIQREFVRLAQIFKARLTTEREWKLHVMERAMIEQRVGDYLQELKDAKEEEEKANKKLKEVQNSLQQSQIKVLRASSGLQQKISELSNEYNKVSQEFSSFQKSFTSIVNVVLTVGMNQGPFDISDFPEETKFALYAFMFPQGANADPFVFDCDNVKEIANILRRTNVSNRMTMSQSNKINGLLSEPKDRQKFINRVTTASGFFKYGGQIFQFKINSDKQFELVGDAELEKFNQATTEYKTRAYKAIDQLEWFNLSTEMELKLKVARDYLRNVQFTNLNSLQDIHRIAGAYMQIEEVSQQTSSEVNQIASKIQQVMQLLGAVNITFEEIGKAGSEWSKVSSTLESELNKNNEFYKEVKALFQGVDQSFGNLAQSNLELKHAQQNAQDSRLALDHRKFLDMQIDQTEDTLIDLIEGTRAHTANIDNYLKRIATALEDDFNSQFYYPAFKEARDASRYWNVTFGSMETSTILTNNRSLGKVAPKATIEFDLPKRQLAIIEGMNIADAAFQEYGALVNDPTFLAISSMNGGQKVNGAFSADSDTIEKQLLGQSDSQDFKFGSAFENLIPDPAVFKFETGTGFTVRPVIQPDGQAVVFDLNYLYRTKVREPIRPDEKHLGRVKEHFIDTDVQLGNYELREVSRFMIALKASRTANGVPLLADVPGVGVLFRPTPSSESSLQQSQIMSQAVIFPTLFDLMGLRWAPAVADVGPLELTNREFISKGRDRYLKNRVYDYAGSKVDQFLQIPESERRSDLYRSQQTIPDVHPNGYMGPGLNMKRSHIQENFHPEQQNPAERFVPESNMQERIDTDRAIPVLPTVPRIPPAPAVEGPTSSTRPIRDSGLKPASWSPTSEAPKSGNQSQDPKGGSWISSPRRITKPQNQQTQTQTVKPAPVRQAAPTPRKIQPAKPESPGFYKRSVSRFKSLFKDD